jgi:hypothetical protein
VQGVLTAAQAAPNEQDRWQLAAHLEPELPKATSLA